MSCFLKPNTSFCLGDKLLKVLKNESQLGRLAHCGNELLGLAEQKASRSQCRKRTVRQTGKAGGVKA